MKDENQRKKEKILTKTQLERISFTLKKYLCEITSIKEENQSVISLLSYLESERGNDFRKAYQAFDGSKNEDENFFPVISKKTQKIEEKLESQNQQTKKEIEKLENEKILLLNLYKESINHTNQINNMLRSEEENNVFYVRKNNEISQEIKSIHSLTAKIDSDINTHNIFSDNLKSTQTILIENANQVNEIFLSPAFINKDPTESIKNLQKELKFQNERLEEKNKLLEKQINQEKKKILSRIEASKIDEASKREKEVSYSKLILGLEIIKKFFIDFKNTSHTIDINKHLYETEDYLVFKNFSLKKITENTEPKFSKEGIIKKKTLHNSNSLSLKNNSSTPRQLIINDIVDKFDNLDLDYDQLLDFSSYLISRKKFYQNFISSFNWKCFELEKKKESYSMRVKEIISRNYKNFNDLRFSNSRIDKFLNLNQNISIEVKRYKLDLKDKFMDFKIKYEKFFREIRYFINTYFSINKSRNSDYSVETQNKFFLLDLKFEALEKKENQLKQTDLKTLVNNIILNAENIENYPKDRINLSYKYDQIKEAKKFLEDNFHDILSIDDMKLDEIHLRYMSLLNEFEVIIVSIFDLIELIRVNEKYNEVVNNNDDKPYNTLSKTISNAKHKKNVNMHMSKEMRDYLLKKGTVDDENSQENDSIIEIEIKKSEVINNSRNPKKLFPFLKENMKFTQTVHEKIRKFNIETRGCKKEIFSLKKKKTEIMKMSNEMIIYNNPRINIDDLSSNTYNIFVKDILNRQLSQTNLRNSTPAFSLTSNRGKYSKNPSMENLERKPKNLIIKNKRVYGKSVQI